ncbi:MAG: hypothetical protein VKJ04_12150 [Vampirovibrionales bacterium]|nr:hypothetical protein [Vampirovibrionales bacterium]
MSVPYIPGIPQPSTSQPIHERYQPDNKLHAHPPESLPEAQRLRQMAPHERAQRESALEMAIHSQPHSYSRTTWNVRDALQTLRMIFPTSTLNWEALENMSVAYLPYEQRSIINYLRRNPFIFAQLQRLSTQSGPTIDEWLSKINLQDLETRELDDQARVRRAASTDRLLQAFDAQQGERQLRELMQTLRRLLPEYAPQVLQTQVRANPANLQPPQYIPVNSLALLAQNPGLVNTLPLGQTQRQQLQALLTPSILHLIQAQARTQQMMMSPDLIRILASLMFNPALHTPGGRTPLAAFEKSEQEEVQGNARPDEDLEQQIAPVESAEVIETQLAQEMHEPHDPTAFVFQRIELSAERIRELCRHLKANGGITLEELQNYQPLNEEEEKLLRYLRQFNIFHAIADLNGRDETLDPSDIRRALQDGTLFLDEEHIELVFKP